jgi:hopene-associated glycosyltransferase HpnB
VTLGALLGGVALVVWLYLVFARGGFWLARERDGGESTLPRERWPTVVAVVPARNEADVIQRSIKSLLSQDYPGSFRVVLVDDVSHDGTAVLAREIGEAHGGEQRLDFLSGAALPAGWTGKLWALQQGVAFVERSGAPPDYLLFTDADIGHAPETVRSLVVRAEQEGRVLVSLMAELSCSSWAERFLIPAFVFFFQMLYPFSWVARKERKTAAAAGGCMLVRREAFESAGGIAALRAEIIDDCALARLMKRQGPIWLGLTRRARSLRRYEGMGEIGRMISRSAYAQLRYSPVLLAGTVVGMALVYMVPPLLALFGEGPARWAGLCAWLMMAGAFQPMLRFYRVSPFWGVALPAIATMYTAYVLISALQVWRGRGGMWKGRAQAMTAET